MTSCCDNLGGRITSNVAILRYRGKSSSAGRVSTSKNEACCVVVAANLMQFDTKTKNRKVHDMSGGSIFYLS